MKSNAILTVALFIILISMPETKANTEPNGDEKADDLKIVVTSLEINNKALNMTYEIRNDSEEDVWIYTGKYFNNQDTFSMSAGVEISEDGHGINIRLNSDMPSITENLPFVIYERFVRLQHGQNQIESIFMTLPVHPELHLALVKEQSIEYATQLVLETGYYTWKLPEKILERFELQHRKYESEYINRHPNLRGIVSPHYFSLENECLISRQDEILFWEGGYSRYIAEGENIFRTVIDNVNIPYKKIPSRKFNCMLPDLSSCSKIEIKYQPSMLDYFFPFTFQQSLLSPEELNYLRSENTLVLDDIQNINTLANDIGRTKTEFTLYSTYIARYRSHIDLTAHYENKPPTSFFIYNDNALGIDGKVLIYPVGFPCLKILTPRIQAIDLRMRCAANLKNQWYRFRFHNFHEAIRQNDVSISERTIYPRPTQWCDDILNQDHFTSSHLNQMWTNKPHICPGAGEGKNHYAMNPNCEPDSPGDVVLLFETKAGWNQHGGQELFTFDNHDPKGGCVLLNDGTVKFIRTKEELNTLKWK